MGQPNINYFNEDLQYSQAQSEEPFWDAIYRKAFPNLVAHVACTQNSESQRLGTDRLILLSNNRVLHIDEKKRRKVWGDILLEYVSVDTTGAPGWIEKDLAIDYLAYAFMPLKMTFLFDWCTLRRVWQSCGKKWKEEYGTVRAPNLGYTTLCVPVPIPVLQNTVSYMQSIFLS